MPSFGRTIGKLSNRSQHNLVEQQQQQHHQSSRSHQHQNQPQHHQQQVSGGAGAPPHHSRPHQQQVGTTATTTNVTTSTPNNSISASASATTPGVGLGIGPGPGPGSGPQTTSISLNSSHRVSAAGIPNSATGPGPVSGSVPVVPESNTTPPSASSIGLSSSESFQQQTPQQADGRVQIPRQQTPHTLQHQHQHQKQHQQDQHQQLQHPHPHHQLSGQQQSQAQPLEFGNPNNLPTNPIPLNNQATAYTARQQPHDNYAELVARSQSARYSQLNPIQTQQPFGLASVSVENLPQTQTQPISSPIVPNQPTLPHTQTAPTETKRSTRKLIKNILSGSSSSRPNSDHYQDASSENASGLNRRPSKRASNTPLVRGNPLLARSIDHPDWVPPQTSGSRNHHSPVQPVRDLDDPYRAAHSNQDMLSQKIPDLSQTTIRPVPTDSDVDAETSSYGHDELAFHQQQAIAQRQAQLQIQAQAQAQAQALAQAHAQAQTQVQVEQQQQQQLYGGQIIVDPAQTQYQYAPSYEQYPTEDRRPSVFVGHLSTADSQLPNPETISQVSHESPESDSEQQQQQSRNSQSTQDPPAVSFTQQDLQSSQSLQQPSPAAQTQGMAPPPGAPGQSRRSGDHDKQMRAVEPPPGPPPGYRHSQGPINTLNALPPTPGISGAPQNYRTSGVQDRPPFDNAPENSRNSPPPPANPEREADPEKQFKDLLTKYKNVKRLYFDGKSQIEHLTSQVEQLQNAVANQRMSQSRTALDDSEYSTRFNRLNGAVNNLSFNIRKDWRTLPGWIERYVSPEAIKTGKQEMTAVGRAVIVRWIVEEIFNKCFHPSLDMHLSSHLKQIEQNIRRFSYTLNSQEEFDALTSKVVNWRMATLEGLQHTLQSAESAEYRAEFTKMATSNLTATLFQYLSDPPPAGVDGSASMIVELAVGIAANLPLESRDVAVTYPLPGDPIQHDIMEPEKTGLPPLPDSGEDIEENNNSSNEKEAEKAAAAAKRDTKSSKSGMLNMLSGGSPYPGSRKGSTASVLTDASTSTAAAAAVAGTAGNAASGAAPPTSGPPKDPTKVRFAGFVAVEVRGRQVLVKAPVWTLG